MSVGWGVKLCSKGGVLGFSSDGLEVSGYLPTFPRVLPRHQRLVANLKAPASNCSGNPTPCKPLFYTLRLEGGVQEQTVWHRWSVRQGLTCRNPWCLCCSVWLRAAFQGEGWGQYSVVWTDLTFHVDGLEDGLCRS